MADGPEKVKANSELTYLVWQAVWLAACGQTEEDERAMPGRRSSRYTK